MYLLELLGLFCGSCWGFDGDPGVCDGWNPFLLVLIDSLVLWFR